MAVIIPWDLSSWATGPGLEAGATPKVYLDDGRAPLLKYAPNGNDLSRHSTI